MRVQYNCRSCGQSQSVTGPDADLANLVINCRICGNPMVKKETRSSPKVSTEYLYYYECPRCRGTVTWQETTLCLHCDVQMTKRQIKRSGMQIQIGETELPIVKPTKLLVVPAQTLCICRSCNHEVSIDAQACPNCGAPYPSQFATCCYCGSEEISFLDQQGFSVSRAALGAILLGPLGLAGGMVGSKDLICKCNKCGRKGRLKST